MREPTLVFDVETVRPVRQKTEKAWPGIEYADSWDDYKGMGIAVVCCFDFWERRFRVFDRHSLKDFRALMRERKKVVGWNNHGFDNPLLEAHNCVVDPAVSFDLMSLFPNRAKLNDAAIANGLEGKTGSGLMAPILWQQGRHAEVIDYCLQDVNLTTSLYVKWLKQGYLIDPKSGKKTLSLSTHS